AARLPRARPRAHRQPGVRADTTRRVRVGRPRRDPRLLRPAHAGEGEPRALPRARAARRESAEVLGPARCRSLGAARIKLAEEAARWRGDADMIHAEICKRAWNEEKKSFVSTFGGDQLDASLLLLNELHFLSADDPRFAGTVAAVERELKRGEFVFRYIEADDFGAPENAFIVCSFWLVDALAALGRRDEAMTLFERLLKLRNPHGMLAEHCDP